MRADWPHWPCSSHHFERHRSSRRTQAQLTLFRSCTRHRPHDLPAYGIEGSCVCWRREAVLLFKKAKLDPSKGLFDTDKRLKELETAPSIEPLNSDDETDDEEENAKLLHYQHGTEIDPWAWKATISAYRKNNSNAMGLQQYDTTKFTRAQRAKASYSGRDPLADVPVKDLRRNLLDFI
jgi:hypothetical protein